MSHDRIERKSVAVIDVFRATSVIITALNNGAERVIPVVSVDDAFSLRDRIVNQGIDVVLGGERKSIILSGFDKGNSPLSYTREDVQDKTIVLTTSNGTRALYSARGAEAVYVAALLNYKAVAAQLVADGRDVVVICSGRDNRYTVEDTLCAGAIINHMRTLAKCSLSDVAWSCEDLYKRYADDLYTPLVAGCAHYRRLITLGLEADIDHCMQCAVTDIVPFLDDELNVLM